MVQVVLEQCPPITLERCIITGLAVADDGDKTSLWAGHYFQALHAYGGCEGCGENVVVGLCRVGCLVQETEGGQGTEGGQASCGRQRCRVWDMLVMGCAEDGMMGTL